MIEPSLEAREAGRGDSEKATVDLLTLWHADLDAPIRLSNDKTTLLSIAGATPLYGTKSKSAGKLGPGSNAAERVFDHIPFSVMWPGYEEGGAPEIRIVIDMIDRGAILPLLRTYRDGRVKCLVESVLASNTDVVNFRFRGFYLRSAPWDDISAQLRLQLTRYDIEPYPVGVLTPQIAPGLFP